MALRCVFNQSFILLFEIFEMNSKRHFQFVQLEMRNAFPITGCYLIIELNAVHKVPYPSMLSNEPLLTITTT